MELIDILYLVPGTVFLVLGLLHVGRRVAVVRSYERPPEAMFGAIIAIGAALLWPIVLPVGGIVWLGFWQARR